MLKDPGVNSWNMYSLRQPKFLSMTNILLKAQKCWAQSPSLALALGEDSLWFSKGFCDIREFLRFRQPGEGGFVGETDWQDLACLLLQLGFKIKTDLGTLVCCTRKQCKLHLCLLLKLPKHSCKRQCFVLKYKPLLRGSAMKGCTR